MEQAELKVVGFILYDPDIHFLASFIIILLYFMLSFKQ